MRLEHVQNASEMHAGQVRDTSGKHKTLAARLMHPFFQVGIHLVCVRDVSGTRAGLVWGERYLGLAT